MATNAIEPKTAATPQHKEVEHFSDAERTAWLKDGTLPPLEEKVSPKEDASAASIPAKESGSGPDKKDKPDQERNWRALESERDTLRTKAEAAEKELEDYRTGKRKPEEKKPEASTAPKLLEMPKRPSMGEYRTADGTLDFEKYEAARDKYDDDKDAYVNQQVQLRTAAQQQDQFATQWQSEIKAIYGTEISKEDIHKVVGRLADTQSSAPELFVQLQTSKVFPHLVNLFQKDPKLLDKLIDHSKDIKTRPDATRFLRDMERDVEVELAKQKDKLADGGDKEPDKKLTRAGKPPVEASGSSSSPADDGSPDAAWRRKDLSPAERGELYRERQNKVDREKRRKKVN